MILVFFSMHYLHRIVIHVSLFIIQKKLYIWIYLNIYVSLFEHGDIRIGSY